MSDALHDGWRAAVAIIESLRSAGYVALLAGGCVRDRLLECEPKDYDVATDATPPQVLALYPRGRKVGAKFGVVLVRKFGQQVEVATFRTEGRYSDGRHPDEVAFGTEIEDARRRDFTINGIFLDPIGDRIIDHVGGQADLAAKIVRTIGDPDRRFGEDHLRMLRAVRFAAGLSFQLDAATLRSIQRFADCLLRISPERIAQELERILTGPRRAVGWSLLLETGLRDHLAAAWPAAADDDAAAGRRLAALPDRDLPFGLALAAVLVGCGQRQAGEICRALRLSNSVSRCVAWMIASLPAVGDADLLEPADLKSLMASPNWDYLPDLLGADLSARDAELRPYHRLRERAAAIDPDAISPPPLLTGDELTSLGLPPGPRMGAILQAVYRAQLNERISTRGQALAMAEELMRQP